MPSYLRKIGEFLGAMDAKSITSLAVSGALLFSVIAIFFLGRDWIGVTNDDSIADLLVQFRGTPWAVFAVIAIFVLLALTGFPQILLIAGTVIAFSPVQGGLYAWIATLTSATVTFGIGGQFGRSWVNKFGGERANAMIDFVGRHGIAASGIVRIVPSAPFIVVNAAAGAAKIPLWKYLIGTGIGIIPKIVLVALIYATIAAKSSHADTGTILEQMQSNWPKFVAIVIIASGWFLILFFGRRVYSALRDDT